MSGVTGTNVHGWQAVGWSALPLAIGGYVLFIAGHPDFLAPAPVGHAIATLFLAAGLFLLVHGVLGLRRHARRQTLMTLRPDQPWLADHPWNPAGIDDSAWRLAARAFWGPFLVALFAVPAHGAARYASPVFWVGAVALDLCLLWALYRAGRLLARAVRFGPSRLEFDRFPFRPGQDLAARYRGPGALGRVAARLRFVEEREETVGRDADHTWTKIALHERWAETQVVRGGRVRFRLPGDAESTALGARPSRYWELEIKAGEYETRFFLPVYRESGVRPPVTPPAAARG